METLHRLLVLSAAAFAAGATLSAPPAKSFRLTLENLTADGRKVEFNRTPVSSPHALYAKGEKPQFRVVATAGGQPAAGETVSLTVNAPGAFPAKTVEVKLDDRGEARFSPEAPTLPGWLYVTGRLGNAQARVGALCDIDAIRAALPPPDDFRQFWDDEIAALAKVPVKATLVEVPAAANLRDKVRSWEFEITCTGPRPVTGYLSLPKDAKPKSLPIYVGCNGAGDVSAYPSDHYGEVAIALQVCKFGIKNGLTEKEYRERYWESDIRDYPLRGMENPRTAFYKWMIVRNLRAIQYAKSRPEWNGRLIVLNGESLGGGQVLIAGALDPDVTFVSSCVPALCDHNGVLAGRFMNGYPQLWKPTSDGKLPADAKTLSENARYFDAANFCTLFRPGQEVTVGTGYCDTLCPPDGVVAAYHNIPAGVKKYLWLNPVANHDAGNWHAGKRLFELLGKE